MTNSRSGRTLSGFTTFLQTGQIMPPLIGRELCVNCGNLLPGYAIKEIWLTQANSYVEFDCGCWTYSGIRNAGSKWTVYVDACIEGHRR